MPKPTRGALIVVEGLDRAGKSSQCEVLRERLEKAGHDVKHIRFPDRTTPIGTLIDNYLRGTTHLDDHTIHLLFSANRWEAAETIRTAIEAGTTVLVDRYSYSGAVYSAAKGNAALGLEWAWAPEIGLPRPDVCLFLRISPEEAGARGGFGAERYENEPMQRRVRELFQTLFDRLPAGDVMIVDAGAAFEKVSRDIWEVVSDRMGRVAGMGGLRSLEGIAE
ncbi:thymidylate kinase [Aspergillus campestris IBT 28561]|uniref:Thymidylate kinase n=1 Tax=Aspergillus campestris (strain IBT 28561) TaxID=1392248 RepID=A0A2I1D899_ASPC2|nr:thymidylate kinase [Aspergillus campestris IBT 28561]PKY06068.1 thymidylate kinase [Aspergillus campestris IBT 28561]